MKTGGGKILWAGTCLFFFMLFSLLLMTRSLQNSELFDQYYAILFFLNAIGLLSLVILIGLNLKRLIRQLKNQIVGSRMTIRMVMIFSLLSVTPVLIVYYFSLDFLHRGIDSWFDLRVEQALDDSLELSRLALDIRMRELLKTTEQTAKKLGQFNDASLAFEIDQYRSQIGANELTILNRKGAVIAASFSDTSSLVPDIPRDNIILQIQQGESYIGLDAIKDSDLLIRVVTKITAIDIEKENRIVQALFPISARMNELAESVQSSYIKYKELSYLKEQLKISFIIILTLVLLFSIFSAVWAAFYSATSLAAPIKNLAEGTRSIAKGNYGTRLPVTSNDELGFLVASFNEMSNKIEQARDTARQSQREAEEQRSYLETILSRLSSGVLVFNNEVCLEKSNISASIILQLNEKELSIGNDIRNLTSSNSRLAPFFECVSTNIEEQLDEWREQITISEKFGNQILMISGTTLTLSNGKPTGHVIVFDEITALIKGQRDAAWSEMARRLAHEIKNPLTPIQLAAERIRNKYLAEMSAEESDTLKRMTNTIIQQVDTMKDMVNDFSDYASSPECAPKKLDIKSLLKEVLDLFSNLAFGNHVETDIEDNLPFILGDEKKLRQVLNNLLKNAVDANTANNENSLKVIAKTVNENYQSMIEIRIIDRGIGIDDETVVNVFEPYVTKKQKGTGLGLAIVKRIVDEHQGRVWLENNKSKGACAVVRLPANITNEQ